MFWRSYYFGNWEYRKFYKFLLKILVYIVVGALTFGLFAILIPHYVYNIYGDYVLEFVGGTTAGIGLSFLVPYLCFRW